MLSVAGGVMAAGPKLTPLTYEYGMLTQPGYDSWAQWHDPQLIYIKYGKGDYTGDQRHPRGLLRPQQDLADQRPARRLRRAERRPALPAQRHPVRRARASRPSV